MEQPCHDWENNGWNTDPAGGYEENCAPRSSDRQRSWSSGYRARKGRLQLLWFMYQLFLSFFYKANDICEWSRASTSFGKTSRNFETFSLFFTSPTWRVQISQYKIFKKKKLKCVSTQVSWLLVKCF